MPRNRFQPAFARADSASVMLANGHAVTTYGTTSTAASGPGHAVASISTPAASHMAIANRTVRFAIAMWLAAGVLMLATAWPGPLAAVLVVPYVVTAWPFASITDAESARANAGWKRFLGINYAVGFLVTMLLIWYAALTT